MFLNVLYGPRPSSGPAKFGPLRVFKRPRTEEDSPLLRVARTRLNPDVEAGVREQETQAQQQAALQAKQPSAVERPVGRPRMDLASKPPPAPKRPVGRPRASAILQAPPAEQEEQAVLRIIPNRLAWRRQLPE